jgi:hypothetical protein
MRTFLAALAVVVLALAVHGSAATTWSTVSSPPNQKCVKGAFTLTTEAAPTSASDGLDLTGIQGVTLEAEAISTMTAGGKFLAYLYNPATSSWAPVSSGELHLTAAAVPKQAWPGFAVAAGSRIAFEPSGIGTAPATIYLCGEKRR